MPTPAEFHASAEAAVTLALEVPLTSPARLARFAEAIAYGVLALYTPLATFSPPDEPVGAAALVSVLHPPTRARTPRATKPSAA